MRFDGEEVKVVAVGTRWVAAFTSLNYLRIFTDGGLQVCRADFLTSCIFASYAPFFTININIRFQCFTRQRTYYSNLRNKLEYQEAILHRTRTNDSDYSKQSS